jgi:hypothetical protein
VTVCLLFAFLNSKERTYLTLQDLITLKEHLQLSLLIKLLQHLITILSYEEIWQTLNQNQNHHKEEEHMLLQNFHASF